MCRRGDAAYTESLVSLRGSVRNWLLTITGAVVIPVALLALLETGLRTFHYGYPANFLLPTSVAGRRVYTNNPRFGFRFFPRSIARGSLPLRVPPKPPDTYRIFVLGDSAALGDPEPSFGFSRMLELMWKAHRPGHGIEVFNVAMTAINSHVVRVIAGECAEHQPDLFIVYVGNNEVVGPFGPATVFTSVLRNPVLIRAAVAVKGARIGQLLDVAARRAPPAEWGGMEMFAGNEIAATDARLESVYRNFTQNLRATIRAGRSAGARVLVCTVPVNLRDCAPFSPRDGAGVQFRSAQSFWDAGDFEKARAAFTRARDLDALRFRTDSRLNAAIRDTVAASGAELLDAERIFAAASPHGIPGNEVFYEHVHMNFHGNYVLARAIFERIAAAAPVLAERDCAEQLAFTDWNRYRVLQEIAARMKRPPFVNQLDHTRHLAALEADLAGLRHYDPRAALAVFQRAVAANPHDWMLRETFAAFLHAHGNPRAAAAQLRSVIEWLPWYAGAHSVLGLALADAGEFPEANSQCEEAIRLEPFTAEWRYNLGNVLATHGDLDAAIARYREALALQPALVNAHYNLGIALARARRRQDAALQFRETLRLRPGDLNALNNLGVVLVEQGKLAEAEQNYEQILRIAPGYAVAHRNLAAVLAKLGRENAAREHLSRAQALERGAGSPP